MKHRHGHEMLPHGLASEMVASLFASDLGIPVQPPLVVSVDASFAASLPTPELRAIGNKNIGLNFGTEKWDAGFDRWDPGYPVTSRMRETMGEILAFDAMISNVDRMGVNPNCAVLDERVIAYDHELAFSSICDPPSRSPWEENGLEFLGHHAFRRLFKLQSIDLSRLRAEARNIHPGRANEYLECVPALWTPDPVLRQRMVQFLNDCLANVDIVFAKVEAL